MFGLQQGQADVQFDSYDGRAAKHGCGGNGFATGSCVGDACDAEHVQTEPRAAGDSVEWQTRVRITLVQSTWPSRSRTS